MEQNMEPQVGTKPKKKGLLILGIVLGVSVVAAAAFLGGRLLNRSAGPLGMIPLGNGGEGMVSSAVSIEFEPAPELPTTQPDVVGTFVERQDNTIIVQGFSMDAGGGGVVVSSGGEGSVSSSHASTEDGPRVEVVVTNETLIYADVTPFDFEPGDGTQVVQQVVEPGSLDNLGSQTMVTVWGRKVGDRVIADVIAYSSPVMISNP